MRGCWHPAACLRSTPPAPGISGESTRDLLPYLAAAGCGEGVTLHPADTAASLYHVTPRLHATRHTLPASLTQPDFLLSLALSVCLYWGIWFSFRSVLFGPPVVCVIISNMLTLVGFALLVWLISWPGPGLLALLPNQISPGPVGGELDIHDGPERETGRAEKGQLATDE